MVCFRIHVEAIAHRILPAIILKCMESHPVIVEVPLAFGRNNHIAGVPMAPRAWSIAELEVVSRANVRLCVNLSPFGSAAGITPRYVANLRPRVNCSCR